MPLIRYEITDELPLAKAPCSCGLAVLNVADVQGRTDDLFEYAGGVKAHPLNFRISALPSVKNRGKSQPVRPPTNRLLPGSQ